MPSLGRNAPCPCGSGKRYKQCHGIDIATTLSKAAGRLDAGDINDAERLARQVLVPAPEHPGAHRIVGRCALERGRPDVALRALLRAARALSSFPLPPEEQFAVWSDLTFVFTQTLRGIDSAFAAAKHSEYTSWLRSLRPRQSDVEPLVSVVLIVPEECPWLERAVGSVCGQNYRQIELIVSHGGGAGIDARLADVLRSCPFHHRMLVSVGASEAELINAGVRVAAGAFVNVLHAKDEFTPERIGALVAHTAVSALAWGFSGVEFIDAEGRPLGRDIGLRTRRWKHMIRVIPEADTIGSTLINLDWVAVGPSNLFFSRALFDELGGMRDLPLTYGWDFCLRAVWLAEPLYVATALYRHRVGASDDLETPIKEELEAAQVPMFHEFYERACDGERVAPNPFAPCIHHWRLHFLKAPFQTGHVLMFGLDRLERLSDIILQRRGRRRVAELEPGLNLVGLAFGEFGLGESMRALAKACKVGGIPFSVKDLDQRLSTRQADRSIASFVADEMKHRCSLYCLNPDMMDMVPQFFLEASGTGAYGIGYWYWELADLPREWVEGLARVDEIWVASEFVAEAVRRSSAKPVVKISPPIEVERGRPYRRSDFRLPEDRFLFLFSFDFNSFWMRKNPHGTIAAFKHAFESGRRDVGLVMKFINAAKRQKKLQALETLLDGDDRIILMDEFLSRDQVSGLHEVVDAYVSLHRSEGFGLGLAESMYLGKPVIGTGYSGNLEFMDNENSCLVDFELVPVRTGEYLYDDARFQWADPDVEQAAWYMRRLVDDADFRNRIGHCGQTTIRSRFTYANTAALIRARLGALGLLS